MKILVTGLGRSGNHPIIHWIMAHYKEEFLHLNGLMYRSKDARIRKSNRIFRDGKEIRGKVLEEYLGKVLGTKEEPDNVLFSCENQSIPNSQETYNKYFDEEPMRIVILRSYKNVMASRLKKYNDTGPQGKGWFKTDKVAREIWCNHARQILITSPWFVIKYDLWCTSENYRRSLERKLNLKKNVDGDLDFIPLDGGGSSFDRRKGQSGLELARKANKRHLEITLPEEVENDKVCINLSNIIFGEL